MEKTSKEIAAIKECREALITDFVGRRIVEEEQKGESKAAYGKGVIKSLSVAVQQEFGKGFSVDNLENMRRFYLVYSNSETLSRKSETPDFQLSWSHCEALPNSAAE